MEDDDLKFIKSCVRKRKIYWTYHVNMRLQERYIERKTIFSSVDSYEIIEKYPGDKYLPSCLVYAEHEGKAIHIQIAIDRENDHVRIVTSYEPSLEKWEPGFKRRRKR